MKLPGFRKGKVPPEMVVQRLGREAVLTQALESSLGDWYERAMLDSGVNPVGDPKLDLSDLPDEGKPLQFSIEVAVRPRAELGEYKGLEVGREEPEVPEEAVDTEINRLREGFARLNPVDRAAKHGRRRPDRLRGQDRRRAVRGRHCQATICSSWARDVSCLSSSRPWSGRAGDERQVSVPFPDDYPAEEVAGKTAEFDVTGQGGPREGAAGAQRRLRLPRPRSSTPSPSCASTSPRQIRQILDNQIAERFREDALDAAVDKAKVDLPDRSSRRGPRRCGGGSSVSCSQQGMDPESYLQIQGKTSRRR